MLNGVEHQWGTSVSQLRNRLLVNYHVSERFYRLYINLVMNVVSLFFSLCREKNPLGNETPQLQKWVVMINTNLAYMSM